MQLHTWKTEDTKCFSYHTGKSLLWVAALISVVLYIYAVLAYAGYQIYFEDPDNGSHCKTLFECVVSVFRLGLLNGALTTVSEQLTDLINLIGHNPT